MKIVIVGAGGLAVATARILSGRGHDVILVERDKGRIDALSEDLDCGFIHGDGSKPAILAEAAPVAEATLFCLTDHDQDNILAALVGRSLGFKRVVPKIEDPEFDHICVELGLSDTIVPVESVARALADMLSGAESVEMASYIRGEVRFFPFVARDEDAGPTADLDLPDDCALICLYRGEDFIIPGPDSKIRKYDEGVLITHSRNLPSLRERWGEGGEDSRKG